MFLAAIAAAASSWVLKILHELQVTFAPSSISVSMSTAVSTVMCKQPAIRAPVNGFDGPYFRRSAISPGISFSASMIFFRPRSASDRSRTLYGKRFSVTVDTRRLLAKQRF
jgi:hypothetical protein